ncbi:hypothetical protein U9M48_014237 [Paspalum notatum var. saurae]|uniref:Uncharacterized protein n=1 Tax=Paspalum notatum var. saurae TaxID=547442 RepID=A0AAQ3T2F5_PASNO
MEAELAALDTASVTKATERDKENAKSSRHVRRRVKSSVEDETLRNDKCDLFSNERRTIPFTKGLSRNVIDIASREMGLRPI